MSENTTQDRIGTYYCEECGGYYDGNELADVNNCRRGHVVKKISDKSKSELWPKSKAIPVK